MYIDAQYVLNGISSRSRRYSQGTNGDLWVRIFALLDDERLVIEFVKTKSHIKSDEEWIKYNMTAEALILNEGVDAACTVAADRYCKSRDKAEADSLTNWTAVNIALRLAHIEASIWRDCEPRTRHIKDHYDGLISSYTRRVAEQLSDAINATSGEDGHQLHIDGARLKCSVLRLSRDWQRQVLGQKSMH